MKRAPLLALVSARKAPPTLADRLVARAYHPTYRPGEVNRCPGCGRSQWFVGRTSAVCAFERCGAIVPLAPTGHEGGPGE